MGRRTSPLPAVVLSAVAATAAATAVPARAEIPAAPLCPASLGEGMGLRSFSVFAVAEGTRFELAPEIDGATLAWVVPAGSPDAIALLCLYEDDATMEVVLPVGRGLSCTVVWDEAAARYADAPRCTIAEGS
ncbi:hypothetical protein ACTZWW_14345 [Salinarimonas sp. NSM]|uniref:hypothetical protein n=1 Tax=Salinarimonas sp. NSM TaxID=3458003 RepID=UPI0040363338